MSKYDEMSEAANAARKRWSDYRERCWGHLAALVNGLVEYCQIPRERIEFLHWNGKDGEERRYKPPEEEGQRYGLAGAVEFDSSDGFWHLGIFIPLTPVGAFPEAGAGFVLCVDDNDGVVTVKLQAYGRPRQIDLTDQAQCSLFYEDIVQKIVRYYRDPKKGESNSIGFVTERPI